MLLDSGSLIKYSIHDEAMNEAILGAKGPVCRRWHNVECGEVRMMKSMPSYNFPRGCERLVIPLTLLENDALDKSAYSTSVTLRKLKLTTGTSSGSLGRAFVDRFKNLRWASG